MEVENRREQDITDIIGSSFGIKVDGNSITAVAGESVLSTLFASNIRQLMENDYGSRSGAYCGMGVCHCCLVHINGKSKQRACQTLVAPNMIIVTNLNEVMQKGGCNGS